MNAPLSIPRPSSDSLPLATPATFGRPLAALVEHLERVESHENPDVDVPLRSLRLDNDGLLQVPDLGLFTLNDWSRDQLGRVLGLSWGRFFEESDLPRQAEELNRRMARAHGIVRLRTTQKQDDKMPGDGLLRAVVSKGYSAVKDSVVAALLCEGLTKAGEEPRVLRSSVTAMTTSFAISVGEPYTVGGPGNVGDVWGSILCRNSGVAYAKLEISLHLVRLVCKNGMTTPVGNASLFSARHRGIEVSQLRATLDEELDGLGERLHQGALHLGTAAGILVEDVEGEIRRILRDAHLPIGLLPQAMAAYRREPHASRFGVSQALTLASQQETSEVRFEMDAAAGAYLRRS